MGLFDGLADKIREKSEEKWLSDWTDPNFRKAKYDEYFEQFKILKGKDFPTLREYSKQFPLVMPLQYNSEFLEYFKDELGSSKTSSVSESSTVNSDDDDDDFNWDLDDDYDEKAEKMEKIGEQLEEKRDTGGAIEFLAKIKKSQPEVYESLCEDLWLGVNAPTEEEMEAVEQFLKKSVSKPEIPTAEKAESDDDDMSELEEKLAKIKKLFDKGLISEADYNKKKEAILEEM